MYACVHEKCAYQNHHAFCRLQNGREIACVSYEGALALLHFAILYSSSLRSNTHVGVVVFVAYAVVQANQLGGSTPTYDVYDSDNYPLVSWTSQQLPCECHQGPLAIMQCTEHGPLPKAQSLALSLSIILCQVTMQKAISCS